MNMIEKIINLLKNKKVAILGMGREGLSTYHFIRKHLINQELWLIDQKDTIKSNEEIKNDPYVTIITGDNYLDNLEIYDLILKTPGISFKDIDTSKIKEKIYSQVELFLKVDSKNVIGITGTKGKSTTSSLIYKVLKDQNIDTKLVGNIGIPIFDEIENIGPETTVVTELSSHQLEFLNISPHIGIILNMYEDHLDHAGTVEHYHACKMHMFDFQTENDLAIYCDDNYNLHKIMSKKNYKAKKYKIKKEYDKDCVSLKDNQVIYNDEVLYIDDGKRNLLGTHNLENIMVVSLIAKLFNLDIAKAKETIDGFHGLEHRLELVGTYDDIIFYNDTIATIPEATIEGIKALKKVDTLIFGGMDRGIEYDILIDYLTNCDISNLICMPTTGYKIGHIIEEKTNKRIFYTSDLEEAVKLAKKYTKKDMICLLSPAAPSYEYFKNFEEKGNFYKKIVTNK